ncbi:MAG TPA: AMP-binding protein [Phenylobacterium sp.]|uniref:AMP-binding protein n=1 Tax=Phenylobacterium sp. TaxID=1871053 RepID=UPI002B46C87E|nr:AMP-binding protein [Phenylobacterium sp.]HKR90574.1 AMP-binding protein [Phenylobacterium sp.]
MPSLRARLIAACPPAGARLVAPGASLELAALAAGDGAGAELAGRSVLVRTATQLGAAQALVELDGRARRLVLCPPDLAAEHLPYVVGEAGVEAVVTDAPQRLPADLGLPVHSLRAPAGGADVVEPPGEAATEWLLFTSGTTGKPKLVIHRLAGLTGAIAAPPPSGEGGAGARRPVWATFYDIRRYGGLQVLLRALVGGCALALSEAAEPLADRLARFAALGVTHVTGTPSHWRLLLMHPQAGMIAPAYVRLSGEIADQAVLDRLRATFPDARIVHAYASTEAGVGFEVDDGLEGFPEHFVGGDGPVALKVVDGSLRIRSARAATGYAGPTALTDDEGFFDTDDMVELKDRRWRFVGRRSGVINVGGLKVHPEEVEAVINRHPAVRVCRVRARRSPITGSLVSAEVALDDPAQAGSPELEAALRDSIFELCRASLPPHKAPAMLRFVSDLQMTPGGKLERTNG